uniref:Uncharacterized protein n=1 Tax=Anopheles coluzzii TaxID=1518534 RepID=A0A6E8VQB7_ANOCL
MKFLTITLLVCLLSVVCCEEASTAAEKEQATTEASDSEEAAGKADLEKDDGPKDKPDIDPVDFLVDVIKNGMKRVSGFRDAISVLPFSFSG